MRVANTLRHELQDQVGSLDLNHPSAASTFNQMLLHLNYLHDLCTFNVIYSRTKTLLSPEELKEFQSLADSSLNMS